MLELYKRIRQRRQELNMTQAELARRLGYKSRSSINKIEFGEKDIPQSKIVAFATALDTTPEYLMGWSNASEPQSPPKDESRLLGYFRAMPEAGRQALLMVAQQMQVSAR